MSSTQFVKTIQNAIQTIEDIQRILRKNVF